MEVELLVIPGCPGAVEASELLRAALDDLGLAQTPFAVHVIVNDDVASGRRFAGSPAFIVDGVDLFARAATSFSMACRVYPTPCGPRNVPAARDLRAALEEHRTRGAGA
ncbi:MAG: hypothetical protein ABIU87_07395 [Ornithinibacter sp.]